MVVMLTDGEQLEGVIEWYDRDCLKLNREGAPNLLLFKHCIKYMYKAGPNSKSTALSGHFVSTFGAEANR